MMRSVHLESITTPQLKYNIIPYLNNKSSTKRLQALVRTANYLMNDAALLNIYMDIVKISDTRSRIHKLYICYILQMLSKSKFSDNLLVLNTNTLLKDLSDNKTELVTCAIDFIGRTNFQDEYILRYFIKLAKTSNMSIIKNMVAKNIIIYMTDELYIKKFQLKSVLRNMCFDPDNLWALNSVYLFSDNSNILSDDDILEMYKTSTLERRLLLLMIIKKKMTDIASQTRYNKTIKQHCFENLNSISLELIYLSASILLLFDNEYSQLIYDKIMNLMQLNYSSSFLLLEFIREMILKQNEYNFVYSNTDFIIFTSDSLETKRIKLDILCLNFDPFSYQEMRNCEDDKELIYDLLYIMLIKNICDADILMKCCNENITSTLQTIKAACPLSNEWKKEINNIFDVLIKPNTDFKDVISVATEVISDENILKGYELSLLQFHRLYLNLYKQNILTRDEFKKKMNWKSELSESFDQEASKHENHDIEAFSSNVKFLELYKFREHSSENNNLFLPIIESKDNLNKTVVFYEYVDADVSLNFELDDYSLILNIIRIDKSTQIRIENILDKTYLKKCKETIKHLTMYDLPLSLEFTINNNVRALNLTIFDLMKQYKVEIKEYNEKFSDLKYYKIIEASNYNYKKYIIDDTFFAFKVFGCVIFGLEMCGQIILKSEDEECLEKIVSSLQ